MGRRERSKAAARGRQNEGADGEVGEEVVEEDLGSGWEGERESEGSCEGK